MKKLLNDRQDVYGDYEGGIVLRHELMNLLAERYYSVHKQKMPPLFYESLHDVINKLTRIAVTPDHIDSWTDVIGYSTRILECIERRKTHAVKRDVTRLEEPCAKSKE